MKKRREVSKRYFSKVIFLVLFINALISSETFIIYNESFLIMIIFIGFVTFSYMKLKDGFVDELDVTGKEIASAFESYENLKKHRSLWYLYQYLLVESTKNYIPYFYLYRGRMMKYFIFYLKKNNLISYKQNTLNCLSLLENHSSKVRSTLMYKLGKLLVDNLGFQNYLDFLNGNKPVSSIPKKQQQFFNEVNTYFYKYAIDTFKNSNIHNIDYVAKSSNSSGIEDIELAYSLSKLLGTNSNKTNLNVLFLSNM
uniref:ATP synthase F0 subunit b n=1 Tax=Meteora sporadica TaxID=2913902 RepID=UPI003002A2AB|nr:ATP synthase F0 subunit b [Meteora sporadica]